MKKTLYSAIMLTLLSGSIVGTALADNYESNDTLSTRIKSQRKRWPLPTVRLTGVEVLGLIYHPRQM